MRVVILAGGLGSRISEESHLRPKPMIEIGNRPIMWHIMKHYSHYGHNEFIVCAGYKQHIIKEYFANYGLHASHVTFDLQQGCMEVHSNTSEPWKVTVVDTGLNTMTAGRVRRVREFIGDEPFFMTYGDGVSDVDLNALLEQHCQSNAICTLTTVSVAQRFGVLEVNNALVSGFREKQDSDGSLINAGFMVCEPKLFDYIDGDFSVLEKEPLERLSAEGSLGAYHHTGFWQCMDTQREREKLEEMWQGGMPQWKTWEND